MSFTPKRASPVDGPPFHGHGNWPPGLQHLSCLQHIMYHTCCACLTERSVAEMKVLWQLDLSLTCSLSPRPRDRICGEMWNSRRGHEPFAPEDTTPSSGGVSAGPAAPSFWAQFGLGPAAPEYPRQPATGFTGSTTSTSHQVFGAASPMANAWAKLELRRRRGERDRTADLMGELDVLAPSQAGLTLTHHISPYPRESRRMVRRNMMDGWCSWRW